MEKNIGDMTESELKDFIVELQEENSRYERKLEKVKNNWNELKEKVNEGIRVYRNRGYDLIFEINEVPKEELNGFICYLAFQTMEEIIKQIESRK